MSENDQKVKAVKKYSIYFTPEEYDYLEKKADEESLRTGIFIKKLLVETLRNHQNLQDEDNPFRKSTKKI